MNRVLSQNQLLRIFFFQNSLCMKIIPKLASRYHIIKTVVNDYDFMLNVITVVDEYDFKTVVISHGFNIKP